VPPEEARPRSVRVPRCTPPPSPRIPSSSRHPRARGMCTRCPRPRTRDTCHRRSGMVLRLGLRRSGTADTYCRRGSPISHRCTRKPGCPRGVRCPWNQCRRPQRRSPRAAGQRRTSARANPSTGRLDRDISMPTPPSASPPNTKILGATVLVAPTIGQKGGRQRTAYPCCPILEHRTTPDATTTAHHGTPPSPTTIPDDQIRQDTRKLLSI
jgi:hypothetical protein